MNNAREHLMFCLARQVGLWSPYFQEAWLKKFSAEHSEELTDWVRTNANEHRAWLSDEKDRQALALKKVASDAINECRRATQ